MSTLLAGNLTNCLAGSRFPLAAALLATAALSLAQPVLAEPVGTARGFVLGVPTTTAGFMLDMSDLLEVAPGGGPSQQTQSGSTAEDWRAAREAKRNNLSPPQRAGMEAGLAWLEDGHWLQRISAGWNGFLPSMGGFPSGSGQAFGVSWSKSGVGTRYPNEFTPNRVDLRWWTAVSLRGYFLSLFETSIHRIAGTPLHLSVHGGWQRNAEERFFGIGPDTLEEDRTEYKIETGALGTVLWWQAPSWFYVGGGVGLRNPLVRDSNDDAFPPIGEQFPPSDVPGLLVQPDFVTYDGFVQIDWRNRGNPYRGGLYAVRWTQWNDQDFGRFDFGELDIELQQYFPFLMNKRVIALRARTILTDTRAGQEVPFYSMPRLGGDKDLRGYQYARFTDRNMLSLTAEYRAEVWLAMDLALFVDAGKVFSDRADLDFNDLRTDYGFGLRLKTARSTFLRTDFAFGGEGLQIYFTFDNSFDTLPLFTKILQTLQ